MKSIHFLIFLSILFFAGCVAVVTTVEPTETVRAVTVPPSPTAIPTIPPPTLQPTQAKQAEICSPLQGETLISIQEILTQPFIQPRPGIDDGPPTHHGVDFSHYRRNDLLSVEGVGVQAVLEGEVATIINNRWPYGFAVIVESPIEDIDPALLGAIDPPEIAPTVQPDPKFNWVPVDFSFELSPDKRSIYIGYAHLKDYPNLQVGQSISCGEKIGVVGNTGDSTNPHLHIEMRIGPSGAQFESMAYYITQSTEAERYNYLVWRISNLFQLFDPMKILEIGE